MTRPLLRAARAALLTVAATACLPDTTLPEGIDVACLTDDDCLDALVCHPTRLRCVADETFDLDPPGLVGLVSVEPPLARLDEEVRVSFVASEALLVRPVVVLELASAGAIALAADVDGTVVSENRYASVLPAASVDDDGCAPLSVTLLDRNGNGTTLARAADVCFDGRAPALAAPAFVADATIAAGETLEVGLVFDEDLAAPPSVTLDDDGGPALDVATQDAAYPRFYAASRSGPVTAGSHDVVVVATDRAGNSSTLTVASVTFE